MQGISDFVGHVTERPATVLVPASLFFLLAPGNFFTIPGASSFIDFNSGNPNRTQILAHAVLLGLSLAYLQKSYPSYY